MQVLDVCCGSRMFWFDKEDNRGVFCDVRNETHELTDRNQPTGLRHLAINPTVISSFTKLPFKSGTFPAVVFDPPHLLKAGKKGWLAKKYGVLTTDWRAHIQLGFNECFRVLRDLGTLVFKWNERDIPLSEILALSPVRPVVGHKSGKHSQTHWVMFIKPIDYQPLKVSIQTELF